MYKIFWGKANTLNQAILASLFSFRYQVFRQRLGWDVVCNEGQETDRFDTLNPAYIVALNKKGVAEGCFRLLPTTGDYMLKHVFPEMIDGENAPCDETIWELSRFAVMPRKKSAPVKGGCCAVTFQIIRSVYDFAVAHGINRYVFVTSVAVERLLRRLKLPVSRFGSGHTYRLGKVRSVVLWVDINDQFRQAMYGDTVPVTPDINLLSGSEYEQAA